MQLLTRCDELGERACAPARPQPDTAVSRRLPFMAAVLAAAFPVLASGQTESDYYAQPKTAPEFWRAALFEIRTGSYRHQRPSKVKELPT